MAERLEVIRSAVLADMPHGFFGRRGGVSRGEIAGLQAGLGAGDDETAVAENRRLAAEAVCAGCDIITVHQIHSAKVEAALRPWPDRDRPHADALVCDQPGMLLAILTADCAPVLLADLEAGVIGAAHAGWKGALAGVLGNVVAAMGDLGAHPERITAAIGPAIAQPSYEVDQAFRDRFVGVDGANDRFFSAGAKARYQFNLPGYVTARLEAAGVTMIDNLALDTYADEERFYSYRRATHRGEAQYGRQISLIALGTG